MKTAVGKLDSSKMRMAVGIISEKTGMRRQNGMRIMGITTIFVSEAEK